MKRNVNRSWVAALCLIGLGLACGGCISSTGLLTSLADDMALTTAAAAEGLVTGVLQRLLGL